MAQAVPRASASGTGTSGATPVPCQFVLVTRLTGRANGIAMCTAAWVGFSSSMVYRVSRGGQPRGCLAGGLRQQPERRNVSRAYRGEVPAVERGDLLGAVTLCQGDHGGVDHTQRHVGILPGQLGDAFPFGF
jgi:hypothetical protein